MLSSITVCRLFQGQDTGCPASLLLSLYYHKRLARLQNSHFYCSIGCLGSVESGDSFLLKPGQASLHAFKEAVH